MEPDDKKSTCIYCHLKIRLPLDNNDKPICLSAMTFVVISRRHEAETSVYPSLGKHFRTGFTCSNHSPARVQSWDLLFDSKLLKKTKKQALQTLLCID